MTGVALWKHQGGGSEACWGVGTQAGRPVVAGGGGGGDGWGPARGDEETQILACKCLPKSSGGGCPREPSHSPQGASHWHLGV